MDNDIVRLRIVGITYNQIENGMYAMVLEEEDGRLRLPIIIGYNEAQSIECMLQRITTPRPLTHEFASRVLSTFGIKIEMVMIKQLQNGIFTADVKFTDGENTHTLDARSSDAIALAMRSDAPIYTTRELLEHCGIERDFFSPKNPHSGANQSIPAKQAIERVSMGENDDLKDDAPVKNEYDRYDIHGLQALMEYAVFNEDYEKAEEIRKEIENRNSKEKQ